MNIWIIVSLILLLVCICLVFYTHKGLKELRRYKETTRNHEEYRRLVQKQQMDNNAALAKQYADNKVLLDKEFQQYEDAAIKKIGEIKASLVYYEDLEKAVVAENARKEEVRLAQDFYHISLDEIERSDISKLKPVAFQLSKPIILHKLIYEIYYRAKLDMMFKAVLTKADALNKGGIYKITNINNNKVYIGRTTNYLDRWKKHSKCGTGADIGAQANTKLYKAMLDEGIENFTFEVLDICEKEVQPAREKYWINYYNSVSFGYNIQAGG